MGFRSRDEKIFGDVFEADFWQNVRVIFLCLSALQSLSLFYDMRFFLRTHVRLQGGQILLFRCIFLFCQAGIGFQRKP